jgi:putative toxin-antitoxin system antitoxin component (TIGR02293 family)
MGYPETHMENTMHTEKPVKVKASTRRLTLKGRAVSKAFAVTPDGRLVFPDGMVSMKIVKQGIPFVSLQHFARHVGETDNTVLAKIGVTGGTVDRRRKAEILKPDESDRLYRLARVTEMAERVLEDPIKARDWLKTKNRALGGVTPFSLLDNEPGVAMVEDVLNRVEFGVYG